MTGTPITVRPDKTQQQAAMQTPMNGTPPADLGRHVAGLVNAAYKGMAEQVASYNLIPLEFTLLRTFLDKEEWTTTQLAQVLPVKPPRISTVVNKFVEMGLMARRFPTEDRRVIFLTLTDKGKALTLELHRRMQAYDATLTDGVSEEEMTAFASVTSKVMANYAALAQSKSL